MVDRILVFVSKNVEKFVIFSTRYWWRHANL